MKKKFLYTLLITLALMASGCYPDESVDSPIITHEPSDDPLDIYIQENFTDPYGIAVRYKFVDRYVDPTKRVTPPSRDVVQPMLDFITSFWVEPFESVPNGDDFFESHVPAEIVFIGSEIYNSDGTITLGVADAGARITLTNVNEIDLNDMEWVQLQLRVIYHEFAHIVHQRHNLPAGWQEISPDGYTSAGSWYNLTDAEALERGFVTPYATSSYNEDFAETASSILWDPDFYEKYIEDEPDCTTSDCDNRNEGRALLRTKYNVVLDHYEQTVGVDLLLVREIVQEKLGG